MAGGGSFSVTISGARSRFLLMERTGVMGYSRHIFLLAALGAIVVFTRGSTFAASHEKPNIIFVLADEE